MAEKVSNINLDAHYTSNPKVVRPARVIVSAPDTMPSSSLNVRKETDLRYNKADRDIYKAVKSEEKKKASKFWVGFACFVLAILGIKGLQKIFRK